MGAVVQLHAATVWALDIPVDWDAILPAVKRMPQTTDGEVSIHQLLRRLHHGARGVPDFSLPAADIAAAMATLGSLRAPSRQESRDLLIDLVERINPRALWTDQHPAGTQYGLAEFGWPLGEPAEWCPELLAAAADLGALASPVKAQERFTPGPDDEVSFTQSWSSGDRYLTPIPPPRDTDIPRSNPLLAFPGIEPDSIEHVALIQWWAHLSAMAEELVVRIADVTEFVELRPR